MKKNSFFQLFKFRGFISIIYYIALLALLWHLIIPHTSFYFKTSIFTPFNKRLNAEDVTLIKGESFWLHLYNINKRVWYSSSNIRVADVDIFGRVTAYRVGTTIIRVKHKDEVFKCRIRVIDISKHKINLKKGKSRYLNVKGAWFGVRWQSSNPEIAAVNRFGRVKGKSKGSTVIYAKVRGKTLSCSVHVK